MSTSPNFWAVYDRLVADPGLSPDAAALVESALTSEAALQATLTDTPAPRADPSTRPEGGVTRPPEAFLTRIEVEGFRGIGPKAQLDLAPGPGLTLVVGRNGSGKSSFAEGLEYALTGDSLRWRDRTPKGEWQSGWRNLHCAGKSVHLAVTLSVEGERQPVSVARHWRSDEGLEQGALSVLRGTTRQEGLDALGWQAALSESCPMLSYNQLSGALERGPSKLFDALEGLLGLDDVATARDRLGQARKAREAALKQVKAQIPELKRMLEACSDERASACLLLLGPKTPDLDALARVLDLEDESAADATIRVLGRLANLAVPSADSVLEIAEALRQAIDAQLAAATPSVEADLAAVQALTQVLRWRDRSDSLDCPVCETTGALDLGWRARVSERIDALSAGAATAQAAQRKVQAAVASAQQLVRSVPEPPEFDLEAVDEARAAHSVWTAMPEGPAALSSHLEERFDRLRVAFDSLRAAAAAELESARASWRPVRESLRTWRHAAVPGFSDFEAVAGLKSAEQWLKGAEEELRDERFVPIAEQAQRTWAQLRQRSNVDLARVELTGSATKRRVSLNVTVDGTEGVALGVMSQGELHALALSLFLPRLTRPDSPFRFVVIDDPVQAMDPAKVDGLARVLHDAAQTHQVVVFTHDARLPDALRRLSLPATVIEVLRRPDSHVEVRTVRHPVDQFLNDAFHVCDQTERLGDAIVRRVVPGLCRAALEAALKERAWRDLLRGGMAHADVQAAVRQANGLSQLATLALLGDRHRGSELSARLGQLGPGAVGQFKGLKDYAHRPIDSGVDVAGFVRATQSLSRQVLA